VDSRLQTLVYVIDFQGNNHKSATY